nr:YigZ family protein [uncultured Desulfuromonas sp.]
MQTEFADANHNCWACLIGAPGNPSHCAMNDDGEPHGSAGKPMLTALQHGDIGDITVVISRYFGGIRLGKGGMARAYTDAVMTTLSGLSTKEKIDYRSLLITCDYPFLDSLKRLFNDYEALLEEEQFADLVTLHLRLPQENVEPFHAHVTEMSHGRITITTS